MAANEDPLEQAIAAQEEAMDSLPDDELAEAAGPRQLSFSFAKRHHVLLETNTDPATLYYTEATPFAVFAEVRRFFGELGEALGILGIKVRVGERGAAPEADERFPHAAHDSKPAMVRTIGRTA